MLVAAGICDIGFGRQVNQDAMICEPEQGLFAVIDGVSGCSDGQLAATILHDEIHAHCHGTPDHDRLVVAFNFAHRRMCARRNRDGLHSLQTCGTVVWIDPESGLGFLGHVGDTRVFLRHANELARYTNDHTDIGHLTDEEARGYKPHLTRAVGADTFLSVGPQVEPFLLESEVLMLMATDGLHHYALPHRIEQVVLDDDPVDKAARSAYHIGLDGQREHRMRGDNITVIAVRRLV